MTPCHACNAPAVRDVAVDSYCADHLAALYATFDPAVFAYNGRGRRCGTVRPEYGHHAAELECNACGATWVGNPGDPCGYCPRILVAVTEHQADLVLIPPDVDPDNANAADIYAKWADRLAVAVEAGLITEGVAKSRLAKEVARVIRAA